MPVFSKIMACLTATATMILVWGCRSSAPPPQFKVETRGDAVYRVKFEDLPKGFRKDGPKPIEQMGLFQGDRPVPIWVDPSTEGEFGPGDSFEFLAKRLKGDIAYFHEYGQKNAYHLRFDVDNPARLKNMAPVQVADEPQTFRGTRHIELDKFLMRSPSYKFEPHELWYWQKLSCTDREPYSFQFAIDDARQGSANTKIHINLRGWSRILKRQEEKYPDHELIVHLDDRELGTFHWNDRSPHTLIIDIPADAPIGPDSHTLTFKVPRRTLPNGNLAIDVVLLNWVEIHYDQIPAVDERPRIFNSEERQALPGWTQTRSEEQLIIGDAGTRVLIPAADQPTHFQLPQSTKDTYFLASGDKVHQNPRIVPWLPGDLLNDEQQADYLMIAHPRLKEAIEPLAAHHRKSGKTVKVVDIRHIYNSFNQGVVHPRAIRNFISHAFHNWQKPAPQFVLLVGDASWDSKHEEIRDKYYSDTTHHRPNATSFSKIQSSSYENQGGENDRNLIPTANFFDSTGHSASDNYFVKVDGDDIYPDLAIGRFPVTEPEEVADIVAKTIAYDGKPQVGPWRLRTLMITNEERSYQRRADKLAKTLVPDDRIIERIYPDSAEKSNEHHTTRILDTMDKGQNLIYFCGHGGRFIWRTGPPDIKKNHDLFTLDDLEKLADNPRLPIVLSFTCYSAPFDHPGADSIGEKFLRLKNRGAIAFVGASWRNVPKFSLQKSLMKSFHGSGTVGQALMYGKYDLKNRTLVETYNLLGDPAVKLLPPPQPIDLELVEETDKAWVLRGRSRNGEAMTGEAIAMVKYENREQGEPTPFQISGKEFSVTVPKPLPDGQALTDLQVYIWDESESLDWQGLLPVPKAKATNSASQL